MADPTESKTPRPPYKETTVTHVTNFGAVGAFHIKFGVDHALDGSIPHHVDQSMQDFRMKLIREEVEELQRAYDNHDLPGIADALIDLAYVTFGAGHVHGFPWQELFDEVQRANITKERCGVNHLFTMTATRFAVEDGDGLCYYMENGKRCGLPKSKHSLRGSSHDVIKPEGWTPPDIEGVLRRFGWNGE